MDAEILFLEILSYGDRKEFKISCAKRRRLKKKASRISNQERRRGCANPVNQSADLSLRSDGLSSTTGDVIMKRKPKSLQLLDGLPIVEDENTLFDELPAMEDEDSWFDELPAMEDEDKLFDELLVVEDEDTAKRRLVSSMLSPLVADESIMTVKSSIRSLSLQISFSTYAQDTIPPSSNWFNNEGPVCSDEHCLVKTRLGEKLETGQRWHSI